MYSTVLFLHSWVRWLALVAGVGATFAALGAGGAALSRAERWGRIFMIALDVQMLLGLLLYGLLSPYTAAALKDFGAAMREPVLRFWAVEHLTMMLAAVIVAHVGKVLARAPFATCYDFEFARAPARPHRPEAQDVALSRPKHGFESRWGRQYCSRELVS